MPEHDLMQKFCLLVYGFRENLYLNGCTLTLSTSDRGKTGDAQGSSHRLPL